MIGDEHRPTAEKPNHVSWLERKYDTKTFSLDDYDPEMDIKRLKALLADQEQEGENNA